MAGRVLFLVLLGVFLFASIMMGVEAGNQIALRSVSADNENNDTIVVTVIYRADYQPHVIWVMPTFRPTGGMVNLEFEQTDTFDKGQGQTTVRIQHEVARTQNSRIFLRHLILRNQDCEVKVDLPPFADLISSPPSTQTFHDLALTLETAGRDLDPGENLVLAYYTTHVNARLSSPELAKFEVNSPSMSHSRFEYAPGDFAVRKNDYGYRSDTVFKEGDWSGSNTTKTFDITFWRTPSSLGIFTLYSLSLEPLSGVNSLVPRLEFKQNLYLLREEGQEPVRRNTVYIKNKHSHYLTEFDMPMNLYVPEFSFTVVGNPLPQVSLYRACSGMSESEVEMFESRVYSRYEVTYFFRFLNATEAIAGSYNVVARSGTMEAREIMSLGLYRHPYYQG